MGPKLSKKDEALPKEEDEGLLQRLPDLGLSAEVDPLGFREALLDVGARIANNPSGVLAAGARWGFAMADAATAVAARALGAEAEGPASVDADDKRFSDPTWEENPVFFGLLQSYLVSSQLLRDLVATAGPNGAQTQKATFAVEQVIDALAPTNFLPTNPAALKRAFETGGRSVVKGARRFIEDVAENGGMPRQVDAGGFTLGRQLAATPGKVVFRNRLVELIQYAPQTETVHEVPLLLIPPWINKYYVMDLAPGKSLAEWAVKHGHTVFILSYRNPDEALRDVELEDYLVEGPKAALDAIAEITGAQQANLVGFCIGGTLTTMLLAHLAALGEDRVRSATLLTTLVDFEETGMLGHLVDKVSMPRIESRMRRQGFLEGGEMGTTFSLLRSRDLVWRYVTAGWLMGEDPPAFDLLAWNADSTRMPATMHSQYLRSCYIDNALAKDAMKLAGTPLKLGQIAAPLYVLSAHDDHIAPWRACYKTTQLVGGDVRYVLSSSGHIAGVVNPPSPKRSYWVNGTLPADPDTWLHSATQHPSSWWEDWIVWLEGRSGERQEPPPLGSEANPALVDAPGAYVFEK